MNIERQLRQKITHSVIALSLLLVLWVLGVRPGFAAYPASWPSAGQWVAYTSTGMELEDPQAGAPALTAMESEAKAVRRVRGEPYGSPLP